MRVVNTYDRFRRHIAAWVVWMPTRFVRRIANPNCNGQTDIKSQIGLTG
jgi:hypothetical protein